MKVKGVSEVFVHGDSLQCYTVAIVVPEKHFIEELGNKLNITGTFQELCNNPEIKKSVL